ncbi:MAG: hypothetical protein ABFD89_04755 [Bryobacteraceae bacterium]
MSLSSLAATLNARTSPIQAEWIADVNDLMSRQNIVTPAHARSLLAVADSISIPPDDRRRDWLASRIGPPHI